MVRHGKPPPLGLHAGTTAPPLAATPALPAAAVLRGGGRTSPGRESAWKDLPRGSGVPLVNWKRSDGQEVAAEGQKLGPTRPPGGTS